MDVAGLDMRIGLFSGAEVDVESLKSLLVGGIAFATPASPEARPVRDAMVFRLHDQAEKEWLKWAPPISLSQKETRSEQVEMRPPSDRPFPQPNPP